MEFVDPGPDQPYGLATGPVSQEPGQPAPAPRRETIGLLVMLAGAALLPVLAAFQTFYAVREEGAAGRYEFAVDAWGRYGDVAGARLPVHAPRFGMLLLLCGAGFALLALIAATQLLGGRAVTPARTAAGIAGAAAGLVGLLIGVTAAMTLEITSVFDSLRAGGGSPFGGVYEVRMRIGGAVWMSLAGILAGALAIAAALRVRRAAATSSGAGLLTERPDWR